MGGIVDQGFQLVEMALAAPIAYHVSSSVALGFGPSLAGQRLLGHDTLDTPSVYPGSVVSYALTSYIGYSF